MRAEALIATDSALQEAVIYTLHYYSIFNYPLLFDEIHKNLPLLCTKISLRDAVEQLLYEGKITFYQSYYSVRQDIEKLVDRRREGNAIAQQKKKGAINAGEIISSFPFVEFVGISGSISKNYAEKNSDYDFFIITSKNRLWICRTLLHLFKKCTFLLGRQHNFCMNYFIDTEVLELEEKNQYTAIELFSLIPINNYNLYTKLMYTNRWLFKYLPNQESIYKNIKGNKKSILKFAVEAVINKLFPEQLNKKLMDITDKRWRKKWNAFNYPCEDYNHAFKTRINISKNHPANHQKRVLMHLKNIEKTALKLAE